jgi:hypothetical protein
MKFLLREIVLALGFAILAFLWLFVRPRATPVLAPQYRTRRVTITNDSSVIAHCALVREINLSGEAGTNTNGRNESERDSSLEVIAADAGGDVVLVLERTPGFVRGRIYRCAGPKP